MIGVGIGVDRRPPSSGGASFDVDAQAFFDRVTAAGGTLTTTEKNATNQLVLDMKSAGIWSSMKAVYPMVGASAAACAQNLKSSSFTGTFSSGWTFASTGVTPNGTSAYMDTTLIPNTSLLVNSTHLSYYSRTNNGGTTTNSEMGATSSATFLPLIQLLIYGNDGTGNNKFLAQAYDYTAGTQISISGTNSLGFFTASRTAINLLKAYKNNSTIGSATTNQTQTTMPTNNLYLGGFNDKGVAKQFSNRECAFASIGDGLTDTQASNFYTAVQAFQTTLARQVV
jgi:hypothetical protein